MLPKPVVAGFENSPPDVVEPKSPPDAVVAVGFEPNRPPDVVVVPPNRDVVVPDCGTLPNSGFDAGVVVVDDPNREGADVVVVVEPKVKPEEVPAVLVEPNNGLLPNKLILKLG